MYQTIMHVEFFSAIKWNFTKFLVDKEGQVVKRYGPNTEPFVSKFTMHKKWHLHK